MCGCAAVRDVSVCPSTVPHGSSVRRANSSTLKYRYVPIFVCFGGSILRLGSCVKPAGHLVSLPQFEKEK